MKQNPGNAGGKIGPREKGAFALANLGNVPLMTLISAFLLIYYTDVIGLDPAVVATLFLISRIVDGVSDPIMGFIIDHMPKFRMGRFRPYIIIGSIVCGLNYVLLWLGPAFFTGGKLVITYISYLLIGITFDLMDIPLNSMIPVMTDNDRERNTLSTIKGFSYMIGAVAFVFVAPLILDAFPAKRDGYAVLIILAAGVVILFSILGALGIKERIQPMSEKKYKARDLVKILTSGPVLITFISTMLLSCANSVKQTSDLFFCTYVLNAPTVMSILSLSALAALPGMLLAMGFANRIGKKNTFVIFVLISGVGIALRFISLTSVPLLIVCSLLFAFGSYGKMSVTFSIQADNVDYIEWQRNQRVEGGIASLNTFITKAAQGIGGAVPGYVLALTGYTPNAAQSSSAIFGITLSNIILPSAICLAAALIFFRGYKLDKAKMAQIQAELKARRLSASGEAEKAESR